MGAFSIEFHNIDFVWYSSVPELNVDYGFVRFIFFHGQALTRPNVSTDHSIYLDVIKVTTDSNDQRRLRWWRYVIPWN